MSRLVKSFALLLSFAGLLLGATNANAVACVSAASGNWNAAATWTAGSACTIAGGNTTDGPGADDTVTISSGNVVTVNAPAFAASIVVNAPTVANGITISGANTLTVSGAITMNRPTGTVASTIAVGGGTLSAASITINGGSNASRIAQVTVSTGTINATGSITFLQTAAQARLISTGASTINIGGNLTSGGTLTTTGTGTINFNGGVAQTIGAYATYNNITINNTAGGVALAGDATIGGALSVNTGTLTVGAFTLAVTGATTVNSTLSITSTTGTKTFTGNVTINSGGTLSETVAELITYGGDVTINNGGTLTEFGAATMACAGNLQNDGTYTASAGVHTFSGASKTLSGVNPIVIPRATFTGNYTNSGTLSSSTLLTVTGAAIRLTNNGTITATTALSGTGGVTQGTTGVLNIGAASAITTLTATAVGNTVNYTGGAQTVKATAYHNLGLSGTLAKTMTGVSTIAGALNYSSTGTTTLTAATPISIGTYNQTAGTFNDNANTITVTGTGANTWTKTGTFTTTGTVIFTGAAPQINASNFNNLTINVGAGAATLNGNATVAGNLAVSTGTLDLAAFTANRTAAGGTLTAANGATLKIGGANGFPANYTTHTLGATSTVEYSGTDQSVGAETAPGYGNLTISGSGTKTAAGDVTVGGTLTLTAGTFAVGANTLTLNGPAIAGTPANLSTTAASSLSFGGTATGVNVPGSVLLLNNLTVNNANGAILNSSPTVSGTLALTAGVLTAGSYTLRLSANCTDISATNGTSWVRTSGFVAGNLRLTFPAGAATCTYPVGSGSVYAPIKLTTPAGSPGGTMTGSTTGNEHVDVVNSPVDSSKDANRYWTLSGDTIGASSYVATFNFVTGDVDFGASPLGFVLGRYASGAWTAPTPLTPFALSITASLTGPIVGTTDFVAGEAGFVCSIPSGSPVGTTCVCDNFNRVSLNPSTIYGGNWSVSSNSGSFGLPRIVNNKLRLTDNTGNVSTAATAPGIFPAAGNWITVEFKHYAYNGTGADGIAFTLSDSTITAVPGAFGGSLGYAQKSNPGSDCTTPGGCPGFTGGWVGIAIDEYGNFSNNTEGRTGGPAPGLTLDSVAVRGSGSGQTGYPYIGGTGTLTPGIDNAASGTPAYGYAYRLMVDARCYQLDGAGCSNPSLSKKTLVSVERDTTGTGASYTPLVPAFDAYVANASQADVPANWQLSFTGSTGGSTNIHEILGLKVCAQTYVPPAGYRIQVDNHTPTTCPSDPQPTVTISPLNTNGQVITTYTGTVNLAATLASGGGGGASSATWTPYPGNQGTWDGVNKRYTFAAGDNGIARFYLSDLVQQNVYITVSEYIGTLNSSLGAPVYFSSGASSFVVSIPDALDDVVVAGRPHLMRVSRNTAGCGGGTDAGFNGTKPIDGWYNPAAGDHPGGAYAPRVCAPVSGACLPAYGSCQTLSIAPPVVDSSSNNLSLTFAAGVANFCLITSDVGKYSVGLRDDSVATGTPAVTGTSTTLIARPFAVAVKNVTGNPADNTANGAVFTSAGTSFSATVEGYLWQSTGSSNIGWGDTNGDGLPDVATSLAQISAGGLAPHYADTVTLAAGAPFAPAVPTGVAGTLGNGVVAVAGGSATASNLNYSEAGTFTLTATPATSYLNSAINLSNRMAIFAKPADTTAQNTWVGRFRPHHFDTAVVLSAGVPMPCPTGLTCPASNDLQNGFVYSVQPFTTQVTAKNLAGGTTQNYGGALGYAKPVTLTAWDALGSTTTQNPPVTPLGSLLTNDSIAAATFSAGVATTSTPVYTLATVATVPTDIFMRAAESLGGDGVTSLRTTPSNSVEGGVKVANGRVKIGNAHGSELLPLSLLVTVQYWNGTNWVTSTTDNTALVAGNVSFSNCQKNLGNPAPACKPAVAVGAVTLANGVGSIRLNAPGLGNNGSADTILNAAGWPAWLPSTTARATFGVYKGNNEFIYLRENY